jgi:drug/metabolite transporter (DMT)-like permease
MVIMRASIIVISRLIDAAQLWQGILHKKVYWEENVAVIFALFAVGTNIFFARPGDFEFLKSAPAMIIFISYIIAYTLRIYIMNYYKNTHGKGVKQDNKGFFAIEQIGASFTILAIGILAFNSPSFFHWNPAQIQSFRQGIMDPGNFWAWAILGGTAYGAVSFFSVFIFMFKGRTATFAGLVNRLTSLVAGTAATLIFCVACKGKFPSGKDWLSLLFVLIAVGFIARSEKKRVDELKREPLVDDVCEVIGKR